MKSHLAIRARLAEIKGMLRYFDNREALGLPLIEEMYVVSDKLEGEKSALEWVLSPE